MKKNISLIVSIILVFITASSAYAADAAAVNTALYDTSAYIYKTTENPQVGSIGGEWAVFGLARSGADIPQDYYQKYYKTVCDYVKSCNGVLSDRKHTEYSRVVIALTAIGKNPEDIAGYNLLTPLGDYEKTIWQGLNGPIWALMALDGGRYEMPQNVGAAVQATREMYVNYILDCQLFDGGWSLAGKDSITGDTVSDPDITAMALTALSKYQTNKNVAQAVQKAISLLSERQNNDGGYASWGSENSESAAWVMVALCELGIALDDSRFVKNENSVLDNVLSFYQAGNGFMHTKKGAGSNQMATEQCFYALAAAQRAMTGKSTLFSMNDSLLIDEVTDQIIGLPGKNTDVRRKNIQYSGKTFVDVSAHENQPAIEALCARGIINGKSDNAFDPDATMTRAEFATIIVNGLGLPIKSTAYFLDVTPNNWFYDYVNTAKEYGIVSGISEDLFNPDGTITKEESAAMTARAAALCGINTDMEAFAARDILAGFTDYVKVSDWAVVSVAVCYDNGIFDDSDITINSKAYVTRAEIAQMLFNMLGRADLL